MLKDNLKLEKSELISKDILTDKKEKLKQLFPEIVSEGKINIDKLKKSLGDTDEESLERYETNWVGKANCYKEINSPSIGTLNPVEKDSINFDEAENLFIEGENLEVLKLLQKSYYEKIKMIYIDPPYNTGKDFVYKDNFGQELNNYLKLTGQVDDEGKRFSTNTDSDGRYHSNWMSMMFPRLFLARNLLKEDGVIFISIDDNEVTNLKKICDEVFGEENFVANIIWQKKFSPQNDATYFSTMHDYILCIAKKKKNNKTDTGWERILLPRGDMPENYSNPDNDPRGNWSSGDFTAEGITKNCVYPITAPNGKEYYPPKGKRWAYNKENFEILLSEKRFWFGKDGTAFPRIKRYYSEVQDGLVPNTIWFHQEVGHTQEGKQECNKIFGVPVFDYPKPSRLIKQLLRISTQEEDLILDFFAGSGTTAHAVLELNKEDGGKRRFICVQLPELTTEDSEAFLAGYKNISEITKERIRRVIKNITEESKESSKQKKLEEEKMVSRNLGFKVFKLDKSNFKLWDGNTKEIQTALEEHVNNISKESKQEDILYELILKSGLELTCKIEEVKIAEKKVYSIEDGIIFICLEKELSKDLIKGIAEKMPARFYCLDEGFKGNDQLKANAIEIFKNIKTIDGQEIIFRTV